MKFINESTYWHATGRISNCLNRLLHEVLGYAPATILITCFCKLKITVGIVTPQKLFNIL
jgi:hypothetical protein